MFEQVHNLFKQMKSFYWQNQNWRYKRRRHIARNNVCRACANLIWYSDGGLAAAHTKVLKGRANFPSERDNSRPLMCRHKLSPHFGGRAKRSKIIFWDLAPQKKTDKSPSLVTTSLMSAKITKTRWLITDVFCLAVWLFFGFFWWIFLQFYCTYSYLNIIFSV